MHSVRLSALGCGLLEGPKKLAFFLSINGQTALAFNRLIAVVWPMRYRKLGKRYWTLVWMAISTPSLLLMLVAMSGRVEYAFFSHSFKSGECKEDSVSASVNAMIMLVVVLVPTVLGCSAYVGVWLRVRVVRSAGTHEQTSKRVRGALAAFLAYLFYAVVVFVSVVVFTLEDQDTTDGAWSPVKLTTILAVRVSYATNPVRNVFGS